MKIEEQLTLFQQSLQVQIKNHPLTSKSTDIVGLPIVNHHDRLYQLLQEQLRVALLQKMGLERLLS